MLQKLIVAWATQWRNRLRISGEGLWETKSGSQTIQQHWR
jgi:hypothetical protein